MTEREQSLSEAEKESLLEDYGKFLKVYVRAGNPNTKREYENLIAQTGEAEFIRRHPFRRAAYYSRREMQQIFEILGKGGGAGVDIGDQLLIFSHLLPNLGSERDKVLSVGCGMAPIEIFLSSKGTLKGEILGIDIAKSSLKKARDLAKAAKVKNLRFEQKDAEEMGYDGEFDLVLAIDYLQWIKDWKNTLSRSVKALREGGRLFFCYSASPHRAKIGEDKAANFLTEIGAPCRQTVFVDHSGQPRITIFGKKEKPDGKLLIVTKERF